MAKCASCGREIGFSFGKKLCQWCVEYEANKRGEGKEKDNEYQRVMPTPWKGTQTFSGSFNQLFIGINVLVFAAMVIYGGSLSGFSGHQTLQWGSLFGPLVLGGQPWRLITYMFLHGGLLHIGMNMWCLWQLGGLAESLYDDWLYAIIYLMAGIGGGLASLLWHPFTNTVGASGAVFGVEGALLASLKLGEFSLPRPAIASLTRNVLIFSVYGLIFGAVSPGIDNACHIGGFVVGFICGALVAVVAPGCEQILRRLGICVGVVVLLLGVAKVVEVTRGYVVLAERGSDLIRHNKFGEAIPYLEKAVNLRPGDPDPHFWLANAYYGSGQLSKAQDQLRQVLAMQPNNTTALYHLGFTLLSTHELDEAQQAFAKLLKLNANDPDAHIGLANVARLRGDYQAAATEFKNAVAFGAESYIYYDLAQSYLKLKQYDDAISALKKYEEETGETYQSQVAFAEAYQGKGLVKEADEAGKKAAALKPK